MRRGILPKPASLRSPAWRLDLSLKQVQSNVKAHIDCNYVTEMIGFLKGGDYPFNSALEEAYLMYYLPQSRAILSSLILSGADTLKIAEYIGGREEAILYFGKLFFDISVFPNRLIVKDYIDSLSESTALEKNYKSLMRSAFSLGDRYIAWKMSLCLPNQLLVQDINNSILEDAYWRAREHKPFSIDDSRAKESRAWIPQVLRTLDSMSAQQSGGELAVESLRLKLVKTDNTISIKDLSSEVGG